MTTAPRTAEAMLDDIACRYGAGEPGIGRLELHRAALDFAREHAEAERARHRDAAKTSAPTLPPEIEAAIDKYERAAIANAGALGAPDEHAAHTATWLALTSAITSALAAAREAGRRDVLEGVAGVETSLLKLAAVAYSQGTHAVRARIGEDGADRDHLRASGDLIVAEQSHRAAIAADKAALDDTWRAHDLERDAEVAQAQAATHEACAALQAICAALHVTPPTGSTYCTEAVTMVVERVAADKARAVEAATAELRADLATAHEAIGQAQVEIVRLSSPVPQFRDAPPSPEFTEDLREAAAAARLAAQGIDAGAELVKFTAEHYNRLADAEGPFTTTDATSMREWMAQWPLSADVLPTARITLVRLLRAVEGLRQVLSQADAERLVDAFDESTFDRSNPARTALLAALTGADAPKPTQCGAVDMLRGTPPTSPPAARPVFAGVSEDELIRLFYVVGTDGIDHGEQCPPIDISDRNGIRAVLARLEVSLVTPEFLRRIPLYTKHGPGGKGDPGICDAACVKCEAERIIARLTAGVPVTPERK